MILRRLKGRQWGGVPAPDVVRRLLIVQVEHLGDFLVSSGFHRATRAAYPNAHITVLVDRVLVSLVRQSPYFDDVIGFDQSGSKYHRIMTGPVRAFRTARRELWNRDFDLVINQRWDADLKHGAILAMLALGRYSIGFSSKTTGRKRVVSRGIEGLFTHTVETSDLVHDGLRGGQLLVELGVSGGGLACEIFTSMSDEQFARERLQTLGECRLVALGIGASQTRHQWPVSWYAEVAAWIIGRWPDVRFLVVGNTSDSAKAESLRPALGDRLINYAGTCSWGQSAELLKRASFYFGSDSGPMHIAAAQGLDVVEISCLPEEGPADHPNSPIRYAPVGVSARILRPLHYTPPCVYGCRANKPHCIKGVTIDMAKVALSDFLSLESDVQTGPVFSERS